jgi:hypothetical protein
MLDILKGLFGKSGSKKQQVDEVVSDSLGNYISLAKLEHVDFVAGEILKGSKVGSYNRAYAQSPRLAMPGLEKQLRDSIQYNKFSPNGVDQVRSLISIGHINKEVSGFCWSNRPSEDTYELHMLSVKDSKCNMGLGKALLLDALASYPEGSQVIARIYKDEFKTDYSRSMLNMLVEEGFTESTEQPNTKTTLFSKQLL